MTNALSKTSSSSGSDTVAHGDKKPSGGRGTWEATFPATLSDPNSSMLFAKRMLFLIVGYYFKLRDIYPAKAFKPRRLGDLKLFTLNKETVPKMTKFLMSACKLVDKGYLKEFCVLLNDSRADDAKTYEALIIRFAYVKKDVTITIGGNGGVDDFVVRYTNEEAVKESTRRVIMRMFLLTQSLKAVPADVQKDFRICYTDDTPKNFETEGFIACKHQYNFTGSDAQAITVGCAHAKYHSIEASLKTIYMQDENGEEGENRSITDLVEARDKSKVSGDTVVLGSSSSSKSTGTSSGSGGSASQQPVDNTPPIAPLEVVVPKSPKKSERPQRARRTTAPRPLVDYESAGGSQEEHKRKKAAAEEPPVKKAKIVRSIGNVRQLAKAVVEARKA